MSAVLAPDTAQPLPGTEIVPSSGAAVMPGFVNESSWKLANRIGQAFAASSLVPAAYQGNVANCIVALEMANRMGASPLMVMQNLYIVHGNPSWSSKFLIACFNQSGRFSAMRYEWNEQRTECRAWATEKATGEKLVGPKVTVAMAAAEGWSTKSGSKWKTMPELMLMYRAAAFFVRTYAPEISMGLRTDDEVIDMADEVPRSTPSVDTVRQILAAEPAPAAPEAKVGDRIAATELAIRNAGDAETAALVLDEARSGDFTDAEITRLGDIFREAWPDA